jgi:ABC-type polysaccharide/polyol phosphate transport system ATPase subunit
MEQFTKVFKGLDNDKWNITTPPQEIVKKGPEAVFKFLVDINRTGSKACAVAKSMVVGVGEAGKSALLKALANTVDHKSGPIAKENRTVGLIQSTLTVKPEIWGEVIVESTDERVRKNLKADSSVEIITCDLAGQVPIRDWFSLLCGIDD